MFKSLLDKLKSKTKNKETTNMPNFVKLTRVYKMKDTGAIKTQPITISSAAFASVRPSNRLGTPKHRATITTLDGQSFEVSEAYSEVQRAFGAR